MSSLLTNLNPDQQSAVTHGQGAALVLAGAGSGKTTVLTTRATWLIEQKQTTAERILVVTFTNKAAGELKQRIEVQTGSRLPFSGTFHSLSARILRREGLALGLDPNFVIYDTDDQTSLLKLIHKEHGIDPQRFSLSAVRGAISTAKNELLSATEYTDLAKGAFQEHVARIYGLYQTALAKAQALDFDDLLLKHLFLLQRVASVRDRYQDQFTHVLVDEYQDTNKVQYELTKLLAAPQGNLFVVGDFSQSIYAWRGADYRNMMNLKKDFPEIKEYRLEQNYRSHQTILDAATDVISLNTSHPILKLWTTRAQEEPITVFELYSSQAEAAQVINSIRELRSKYQYEEMAILYRTNAQSRAFEEALIRAGIPYTLIGGTKFYERSEVKDVLAYLKYTVNPADTVSLERITGLGKRRLTAFSTWLTGIQRDDTHQTSELNPAALLKQILDVTNYLEKYDRQTEDNAARIENVEELINVAAQFTNTTQFLENIALIQDNQFVDVQAKGEGKGVNMMSLHSAKGLEFPVVFMVGIEEGLLPHSRSLLDPDQMEEERRLCYVGITRAKDRLFMTYARSRFQYGTSSSALRSRFLNDISPNLLKLESDGGAAQSGFLEGGSFSNDRYGTKPSPRNWRQSQTSQSNQSAAPVRRYVPLDDDLLDGVLQGEIDIDRLIER